MKCPCCNGTGRTQMVTVVKTDSGLPCDFPCIECEGTGEVEMTNEVYIRTATTEQLVDFLFGIAYMCSYCGDDVPTTEEKMQQCHFGKCGCVKNDWEVWLKQPHTKE